ncbi:PREDICTED: pyruvate [Prunus dulcis]|uniref:pyruvate decarboxylase n=1 Tax=Prunus dulcis TaxID=3755 RepID=A0A5E4EEQ8_PRUDU|nr:PREDICTED: pyruvate [Prunus dulcis]
MHCARPNSNDFGSDNRILHHTIGLPDFSHELRCFQNVTCYQAVINNLEDGSELIDTEIPIALKESKPVYISISCNSPGIPHPTFRPEPVPISFPPSRLVGQGSENSYGGWALNSEFAQAADAFAELADASGYALAVQSTTLISLGHTGGSVSTAFCSEIVESADAYLFAGSVFNDYSSVALSKRLKWNKTAYENYHRIFVPHGQLLKCAPTEPLRVNVLFQHVQKMLSSQTGVIADTGDSWFNCQKLKLPPGCRYEFQMQYGSIGWSIGASLGYAQAAPTKPVIAFIGDGSFQSFIDDLLDYEGSRGMKGREKS